MQLEQQESFEIKGPQLEVFGEAETRLPAAAKKRPAALAVLAVALVFRLGHYDFVTLIPKSVTGAVGMPLAEELGGTGGITMAAISITGIFGNILGPQVLRWFHVTDPVAQGVAMGCGSHAFGTVRALEMGEVEGAMGSLSLVITALLTVVIAPFLGNLI